MYPRDEYGSYKVIDRWINAWGDQVPGFTMNEFRGYADGSTRVHTSAAVYIYDHPEMAFAHDIFMKAQGELESFIDAK
jgi:hypothetical protein